MQKKFSIFFFSLLCSIAICVAQPNNTSYGPTPPASTSGGSSSPGAATAYLGQVATRSNIAKAVNGASNQFQTRTTHFARSNITSIQFVIPNVYGKATGGEDGCGATATVTASLEYPVGTIIRETVAAASSFSIPNNTTVITDPLTVSIPYGATFFERIWFSCSTGIIFSGVNSPNHINLSTDGFVFGVTTPDLTGGGAVGFNATFNFFPLAIISQTTRPAICLTGDSRVSGLNDNVDTSGDLGEFARAVGPSRAYINLGTPSDRAMWGTGTNYTTRLAMTVYCSEILTNYGINDTGSGQTAAQLVTSMNAFIAQFPVSKRVWVADLPPATSSSDSGITQTPRSDNAQRIIYNNDLRAGNVIVGAAGFMEVANVLETSQDSGIWITPGYTTDFLHESQLANLRIQNSNVIPVWSFGR